MSASQRLFRTARARGYSTGLQTSGAINSVSHRAAKAFLHTVPLFGAAKTAYEIMFPRKRKRRQSLFDRSTRQKISTGNRRMMMRKTLRTRRPRRRMRRMKSRRYSRRRIQWSRPDTFRSAQIVQFGPDAAVSETYAETYTSTNAQHCIYPNLCQYIDMLGAHGMYDTIQIDNQQLPGTAGAWNNNTINRRLRCEVDNSGYTILVNPTKYTFRFTPDWQIQGSAENTTNFFPSVSKMVIEPFVLTLKTKLQYSEVLDVSTSTTLMNGWINEAYAGSTAADKGWWQHFSKGLGRRMGLTTYFTSADPPVFQPGTASLGGKNTPTLTVPFLSQDGVQIFDSGDLQKRFKIRKLTPWVIPAADSKSYAVTLPPYIIDTRNMETPTLPLEDSSLTATNIPYFPKGYSFMYFRAKVFSNKSTLVTRPPVKFNYRLNTTARMRVKNSKMGGQLVLRPEFASVGNLGQMPSNPQRRPDVTVNGGGFNPDVNP